MTVADVQRFGRDLWLPEAGDESLRVTASGDLPCRQGRPNLESAIRRCICTTPGDLTHRPRFGAGLLDRLEGSTSPAARSALANAIRSALLADPRILEVAVSVQAGAGDEPRAAALTVEVTYRPARDDRSTTVTYEFAE